MSASAGRVLIKFRGNYDSSENYAPLDAVFSNSSTYVCIAATVGHDPTDTDYWQIMAQGAGYVIAGAYFGICSSAGETQNKVVTVNNADNFVLKRGAIVGVQFSATNTFVATSADHVTLNVNGSGVYSIYFGDTDSPEGTNKVAFGEADYIVYYQFDGLHWVYLSRSGVQTAAQTPLETPLTIGGNSETDVEGSLDALNTTKQDALIFDNTPTENSTNPVTSGGVYTAVKKNADGIDAIVDVYGSKNINSYPYYETSKVQNSLKFTDIGDGSIKVGDTASQTASDVTTFYCHKYPNETWLLKKGKYILSGCPAGGSLATYYLRAEVATMGGTWITTYRDFGDGVELDLSEDVYVALSLLFNSGTVIPAGGYMFYPMFRDARIQDATWVPNAKTNRELTELVETKASNMVVNVFMANDEFDVGKYVSTTIPILNADKKTITLNSVKIVGQNTEYVSNCTLSSAKTPFGVAIITTASAIKGKVIAVSISVS